MSRFLWFTVYICAVTNYLTYSTDNIITTTTVIIARCSSYSTFVEQRFRCISEQLQGFVSALERREQVYRFIINKHF